MLQICDIHQYLKPINTYKELFNLVKSLYLYLFNDYDTQDENNLNEYYSKKITLKLLHCDSINKYNHYKTLYYPYTYLTAIHKVCKDIRTQIHNLLFPFNYCEDTTYNANEALLGYFIHRRYKSNEYLQLSYPTN